MTSLRSKDVKLISIKHQPDFCNWTGIHSCLHYGLLCVSEGHQQLYTDKISQSKHTEFGTILIFSCVLFVLKKEMTADISLHPAL